MIKEIFETMRKYLETIPVAGAENIDKMKYCLETLATMRDSCTETTKTETQKLDDMEVQENDDHNQQGENVHG